MSKYDINKYWHWKEVPTTHRSIGEYFDYLHLDVDMIKGKKILDIGAGTNIFAKEVSELNIGAKVYSVEPLYSLSLKKMEIEILKSEENIKYIQSFNTPEVKQRTVASLGEELPFKEEIFDLVISVFCLPMYANTEKHVENFFSDIAWVLKSGGEIRLYPIGLGAIKKKEVLQAIDIQIDKFIKSGLFKTIENKNNLLILRKNNEYNKKDGA